MKVLIACEFSGIIRDAFARRGHDAWSCDLLPTEREGNHLEGDVLEILGDGWDLLIAHPPCTHLSVSGARWFPGKVKEQGEALEFFCKLLNAPIPKICVENPVSVASTKVRKPTQVIHPWQFGHGECKTTCLWLRNLPRLKPTKIVEKEKPFVYPDGRKFPKWMLKTHGPERGRERSRTFEGIAEAMANQWGRLPLEWRIGFGLYSDAKVRGK